MDYKEQLEHNAKTRMIKVIRFSKLKRYQNARRITPSTYSNDQEERSLGRFLETIKGAKFKTWKKGRPFYPILQDIVNERDAEHLLEPRRTKEIAIKKFQVVIDWMIENGRRPKNTKFDAVERNHCKRLENMLVIKKGKLNGIWEPEYDSMMSSIGYPEYFKLENEGQMINSNVDDILKFYKKYSRTPSQLSYDLEERKLYNKLIHYRMTKQGKTAFKWNPEIDSKVKTKKIKNMFEVE